MNKRFFIKAKEREMRVSAVAAAREKADKSRSYHIALCKQYKDNDTKVKVECDNIIHWHHINSTDDID